MPPLTILPGLLSLAAVAYEPPRHIGDLATWAVAAAALLTALTYLFRQVRRAFQWVETIHDLTTRELEHTGPGDDASIKDDLHGVAVALGRLQRRVDSAANQITRNSDRLDAVEDDLRAIYDPTGRLRRDPNPREDI